MEKEKRNKTDQYVLPPPPPKIPKGSKMVITTQVGKHNADMQSEDRWIPQGYYL